MMDFRVDRSSINKADMQRTDEGYLMARAIATRTGVFPYRRADGVTQWELRHPQDVLDAESLSTLGLKPVTLEHPDEDVNPENFSKYAVGTVGQDVLAVDDPRVKDFGFVRVAMILNRKDAVDRVLNGQDELSCGYHCEVVPDSGEFHGVRYTHRQTKIRYNHLALVQQGRMNFWNPRDPDVKVLRADSLTAIQDDVPATTRSEKMAVERLAVLKLDTLEFSDLPEAVVAAVQSHLGQVKRDAQVQIEKAQADRAQAERNAKALQVQLDAAEAVAAEQMEKAEEAEKGKAEAVEKAEDAEDEKADLQKELDAAKARVVELQEALDKSKEDQGEDENAKKAEGEKASLSARVNELAKKVEDAEACLMQEKQKAEGQSKALQDAESRHSRLADIIQELMDVLGDEEDEEEEEDGMEGGKNKPQPFEDRADGIRFDKALVQSRANRVAQVRADILGVAHRVLRGDALQAALRLDNTGLRKAILKAEVPTFKGKNPKEIKGRFDAMVEALGTTKPVVIQKGTPPVEAARVDTMEKKFIAAQSDSFIRPA